MKMRTIVGTALVSLALAACGGDSATAPQPAGPHLQGIPTTSLPPGLVDNPHTPARDTSRLNNGYFGSGHGTPRDTSSTLPGGT